MALFATGRSWLFRTPILLLSLTVPGCVGPPVQVVPNEHSQSLSAEAIEADLAHCDEISDEVQAAYGPHVEIGDSVLDAASENFAIHNRYKAACMRAKGYQVRGSFGRELDPIHLPPSAIEKARAPRAAPE